LVVLATACSSESNSDATTTVAVLAESPPALIAFDGEECSVTGGPLEAGLSDFLMLNTSSASADTLLLKLTASLTLDVVADDVAAGRYNGYNPLAPGGDDPPTGASGPFTIMPADMSEAKSKTFNATSGSWAVVCLQMSTSMAYMGTDVIEVR
jgi:hypothetical protein